MFRVNTVYMCVILFSMLFEIKIMKYSNSKFQF